MKKSNSGMLYEFELSFNLGKNICYINDYADVDPFSGFLIYILPHSFKLQDSEIKNVDLSNVERLFGPLPINKIPNFKGRNAWKFLGKTSFPDLRKPTFKHTRKVITLNNTKDWSEVEEWQIVSNFRNYSALLEYEKVRTLEKMTLYDMDGIIIRTSMHILVLNNKKVSEYYDLSEDKNRRMYLDMANTSFSKSVSQRLLKDLR